MKKFVYILLFLSLALFSNENVTLQNKNTETIHFPTLEEPSLPFNAKLINPLYRLNTGWQDYTIIRENLINNQGTKCPENICNSKENTAKQIHSGNYFYHIGVNGDHRFYDLAPEFNSYTILDNEIVTIATLLKNNTQEKIQYEIELNVPSDKGTLGDYSFTANRPANWDKVIKIRREANIDGTYYAGTKDNQLYFQGDPLPKIKYNNNLNKWFIDLFPQEIVKLVIEFQSNGNTEIAQNSYINITDTKNNYSKTLNLNLELINKPIPKIDYQNIIYSPNRQLTASHRGNEGRLHEYWNKLYKNFGFNSFMINYSSFDNYSYDENGNVTNPSNYAENNLKSAIGVSLNGVWNFNLRYMDYFDDFDDNILDHKDQNTLTIFWQGQGINNFEYLSDKWITAYINTLNHAFNYIKTAPKTERYGKLSNYQTLDPKKIIIYPFEEAQLFLLNNPNSEQIINFYKRLYNETDFTIAGVFSTNQYEEAKYSIGQLINYLDIALISYKIEALKQQNIELEELFQKRKKNLKTFKVSLYGNDAGRNQSLGIRFLAQKAVLKGYEGYHNYAFEYLKQKGDWIGEAPSVYNYPNGIDYGFIYGGNSHNIGNNYKVAQHWNPRLRHYNFNYCHANIVDLQYVHSSRLYHFMESTIDAKIIKYLKSLNINALNNRLEEFKNFFENAQTSNLNESSEAPSLVNGNLIDLQKDVKMISNELKQLYAQYYSEPTQTVHKIAPSTTIERKNTSFSKIYPNPTPDYVTIESNKVIKYWRIVNLIGSPISQGSTTKATSFLKLDFHTYPSGIYLIQIIYEDGYKESKRIIKK